MDTGANKNLISPQFTDQASKLRKPIIVHSPGGNITIKKQIRGKFFSNCQIDKDITFYVLPELSSFDGIIGNDNLRQIGAIVDRRSNILILGNDSRIPLSTQPVEAVNHTIGETISNYARKHLEELLIKYDDLFGDLVGNEMAKINVRGEIRTTTDEPIYTKSYPYTFNMREEVDRQVQELLDNGITMPSKSPYNSPIWVVLKKGKGSGEQQYRVVINYKRLNAVTIADTYPISRYLFNTG